MGTNQDIGIYGERMAAEYLRRLGMQVLHERWRCRFGEIDLIMQDGDELVACEVKTRRTTGSGEPLEALTPIKVRRLRRLLAIWLQGQPNRCGISGLRVDAVGIVLAERSAPRIEHVRGVF
jgi:putative endonuclease